MSPPSWNWLVLPCENWNFFEWKAAAAPPHPSSFKNSKGLCSWLTNIWVWTGFSLASWDLDKMHFWALSSCTTWLHIWESSREDSRSNNIWKSAYFHNAEKRSLAQNLWFFSCHFVEIKSISSHCGLYLSYNMPKTKVGIIRLRLSMPT